MAVKEFGNQFEEFVLEYFRRVEEIPTVMRNFSFRRAGKTRRGDRLIDRESPTDLDLVAFGKEELYAVNCQEWLPSGEKDAREQIEGLVDNLKQGIGKREGSTAYTKTVPGITCVAIREDNLKDIDEEVG